MEFWSFLDFSGTDSSEVFRGNTKKEAKVNGRLYQLKRNRNTTKKEGRKKYVK